MRGETPRKVRTLDDWEVYRLRVNVHGTVDPPGKAVLPVPVIVVSELASVPLIVTLAPMQTGAGLLRRAQDGNDNSEPDPEPLTCHRQPAASVIWPLTTEPVC
jgi:hypothetical protein